MFPEKLLVFFKECGVFFVDIVFLNNKLFCFRKFRCHCFGFIRGEIAKLFDERQAVIGIQQMDIFPGKVLKAFHAKAMERMSFYGFPGFFGQSCPDFLCGFIGKGKSQDIPGFIIGLGYKVVYT